MPTKKMKKISVKDLQELIWTECKRIIRARYPNICYTCGADNLFGVNFQTGHLIAKGALRYILKYDLRLLRPQCLRCNIHHGGMGAIFLEVMRNEEGDKYVDTILHEHYQSAKFEPTPKEIYQFYSSLLTSYVIIKK